MTFQDFTGGVGTLLIRPHAISLNVSRLKLCPVPHCLHRSMLLASEFLTFTVCDRTDSDSLSAASFEVVPELNLYQADYTDHIHAVLELT